MPATTRHARATTQRRRDPRLLNHAVRTLLVAIAVLGFTGCHAGSNAPSALQSIEPAPAADAARSDRLVCAQRHGRYVRSDSGDLPRRSDSTRTARESRPKPRLLAQFSISPALPGHFRFLTPRMIGFQADAALPLATRVRVTIAKGLHDHSGHTLTSDFTWTFQTDAIALSDLPLQDDAKGAPDPGPLKPTDRLSSNTALDVQSLIAHGSLLPDTAGPAIGLVVPPSAANPSASPSPPPRSSLRSFATSIHLRVCAGPTACQRHELPHHFTPASRRFVATC